MPVVINRSDPNGGSKPPDKGAKSPKAASTKAAKPSGKGKAASSSSPMEDQRLKIAGLVVIIVIALAAVLYFMGIFDREPASQVAPPNTIGGPGGNTNAPSPGGQPGGAVGTSGPRGMAPGAPVPDAEGATPGGNKLPGNNNGIP